MVRFLLDLEADPYIEEDLYHSTPPGWAQHFARTAMADLLS